MKRRTPMRRGTRPASTWTPPKPTPYAALGPQEPIRIVTACKAGPVQVKPKTVRSEAYKVWVRKQPCCWHPSPYLCAFLADKLALPGWVIEASHHPPKMGGSTGKKRDDFRCLPLCTGAHRVFTNEQRFRHLRGDAKYAEVEAQLWAHIARWRASVEAF